MPGSSAPSERMLRVVFLSLAVVHLALAMWLIAFPHSFFITVGAFGIYNRHYERDVATFYLAFALGNWIALSRPAWRLPVLAITVVQYAAHSLNHGVDVARAHNSWAGPFDLISLALATLQFAALLWLITREDAIEVRT